MSQSVKGKWTCHHKECETASQGRERSFTNLEISMPVHCAHIKNVIQNYSDKSHEMTTRIELSSDILKKIPFPPSVLADFESQVINGKSSSLIQRVSDHCFVVKTVPNSEAPLGLLYIYELMLKRNFNALATSFEE